MTGGAIEKTLLSGVAGQGVLFAGRVLARAGLRRGLEVTWVPETGPLGSGYTAVATVILAERPIGSPLVSVPDAVVAMTPAARERLFPTIKAGGFMVEPPLEEPPPGSRGAPVERDDVRRVAVPAGDLAASEEVGDPEAATMVALGAFGRLSALVRAEDLVGALEEELGPDHLRLEAGRRALAAGDRYVAERRYMKERYAVSLFPR